MSHQLIDHTFRRKTPLCIKGLSELEMSRGWLENAPNTTVAGVARSSIVVCSFDSLLTYSCSSKYPLTATYLNISLNNPAQSKHFS